MKTLLLLLHAHAFTAAILCQDSVEEFAGEYYALLTRPHLPASLSERKHIDYCTTETFCVREIVTWRLSTGELKTRIQRTCGEKYQPHLKTLEAPNNQSIQQRWRQIEKSCQQTQGVTTTTVGFVHNRTVQETLDCCRLPKACCNSVWEPPPTVTITTKTILDAHKTQQCPDALPLPPKFLSDVEWVRRTAATCLEKR